MLIYYFDYNSTHVSSSLVPPPSPAHRTTTTPKVSHAVDGRDIPEPEPDGVRGKTDLERPA